MSINFRWCIVKRVSWFKSSLLLRIYNKHKLHYDVQTRQVKISGIDIDQIVAIKEQTIPALTSTVITAKYKGKMDKNMNYIASIYAPRTPMITGMPAIVSIDKNNNCKIIIDNCAPYDVTIDRNDILGIMDLEWRNWMVMEYKSKS